MSGKSPYRIRKATDQDLADLVSLDRICFPEDEPYTYFEVGITWIAVDTSGLPVGFASVYRTQPKTWYLARVCVAPKARGNKLQRRFLATIERHGRKEGWRSITTYTVAHNGYSTANILAAGYSTYSPQKPEVGREVVHMRKILQKPVENLAS